MTSPAWNFGRLTQVFSGWFLKKWMIATHLELSTLVAIYQLQLTTQYNWDFNGLYIHSMNEGYKYL